MKPGASSSHLYSQLLRRHRDQEDHDSKPAQANGSPDLISKIPKSKAGLVE
jgi:hypothetical protein